MHLDLCFRIEAIGLWALRFPGGAAKKGLKAVRDRNPCPVGPEFSWGEANDGLKAGSARNLWLPVCT